MSVEKKELGPKPFLIPMPVIAVATYDDDETVNVMVVAWACMYSSDQIILNIDPKQRQTGLNILKRKCFTVAMATPETMAQLDYLGTVSGLKVHDKFAQTGLHATKSKHIDAPVIDELPLTLEFSFVKEFTDEEMHIIGKLVNVVADPAILGEDGKLDFQKYHPLMFEQCHMGYYTLGPQVGTAWTEGKQFMKK